VTREASLLAGLLALAYMRTCSCAEHTVQQQPPRLLLAPRLHSTVHSTCSTTVLDLASTGTRILHVVLVSYMCTHVVCWLLLLCCCCAAQLRCCCC
jgi:hypothetical protein